MIRLGLLYGGLRAVTKELITVQDYFDEIFKEETREITPDLRELLNYTIEATLTLYKIQSFKNNSGSRGAYL